MVLVVTCGFLGKGKSLNLAYLVWNNWYFKGREIYANFTIYGIPFIPVKSIEGLFKMIPPETTVEEIYSGVEKFFAGDELWKWIDSRNVGEGSIKKKDIIDRVLLASRKSRVTIGYNAQGIHQVDKRIRENTEIFMSPEIFYKWYCKITPVPLLNGKPVLQELNDEQYMFVTDQIYSLFNTYEKIGDIQTSLMKDLKEGKKIFIPIEANPAWIKYLWDSGLRTEKQMMDFSNKVKKELYIDEVEREYLKKQFVPDLTILRKMEKLMEEKKKELERRKRLR